MSSKEKIWRFLIENNGRATNAEIANWMRGQKGQLSIGQRLREIRQELQAGGKDLICTELRPGIYLYQITEGQMAWVG